jgi:putative CocE/NonD family hydrolase
MTLASRFVERALKLPGPSTRDLRVERDLRIPMPDGAVLLADRYLPAGGNPPLVLVRSPYGRRGVFGLVFARLLAERGFQVVIQSCRGTFGSGGSFDPFGTDEHDDGLATVAWLREQPWYPGVFATMGPSYLGMVQWAIAADAGPDLKAICPQVTCADFRAPFYPGQAFALETALTWVNQVAGQERRFATAREAMAARTLRPIFDRLPLRELDRLATGEQVRYYQDWLAHDDPGDGYWKNRRFSDTLDRVTAPVSMVGGWHDFFLPHQLADYAALRRAGHNPYLTIGPWRHADQAAAAAWVADAVGWLRAHLLGDRSSLRADPVRIFVTGAEEWRDMPAWPPDTEPQHWHLQAAGALGTEAPGPSEPDRYTYDPAAPTPNLAGAVGYQGRARVDNRVLEARPDVLTFTSAPLAGDMEIFGEAAADLFVRSTRQHTDFFARLCEVEPTGASVNVCDALLRLAPGRPEPEADGTIRVRFPLRPTAHRFRRGNRIRLQVSSGAHPRWARNPGTGEPLATATTLLTAQQQVLHDPAHPSAIVLPVG